MRKTRRDETKDKEVETKSQRGRQAGRDPCLPTCYARLRNEAFSGFFPHVRVSCYCSPMPVIACRGGVGSYFSAIMHLYTVCCHRSASHFLDVDCGGVCSSQGMLRRRPPPQCYVMLNQSSFPLHHANFRGCNDLPHPHQSCSFILVQIMTRSLHNTTLPLMHSNPSNQKKSIPTSSNCIHCPSTGSSSMPRSKPAEGLLSPSPST